MQDGDGHEYCFVDARGYTNCISVRDAVGGTDIVWEYRDKLHAAAALPTEAERKLVRSLGLPDEGKKNPVSCPPTPTLPLTLTPHRRRLSVHAVPPAPNSHLT